jgi:NAD(P)H dehydrogenase (quinone)
MTIVVTGATGHYGHLAVQSLLGRGVPAADIVATGRRVERAADLGVTVREAPYEDTAALRAVFEGADKVLFVSGSEAGKRIPEHRNVVDAATDAGVGYIAYTSAPKADRSSMMLAEEHLATERMLIESGITYAFLRNDWYLENYDLRAAVANGAIYGAAGTGQISGALRADLAEAGAAAIIAAEPNRVYELGGEPFTLGELAAVTSQVSGKPVAYNDLSEGQYTEFLVGVGLPEGYAKILADSDRGAAQGDLYVPVDDMEKLLGRPVTLLVDAVRQFLA